MIATTYANKRLWYLPVDQRIGLFSATSLAAEVRIFKLSRTLFNS